MRPNGRGWRFYKFPHNFLPRVDSSGLGIGTLAVACNQGRLGDAYRGVSGSAWFPRNTFSKCTYSNLACVVSPVSWSEFGDNLNDGQYVVVIWSRQLIPISDNS